MAMPLRMRTKLMKRRKELRFEFVEFVPEVLDEGVLYVSIPYATASHRCCCGCGSEVVTPISPTDWSITFDGVSVSLDPSIGNWSFPCRSHYWIRHGKVRWAAEWSSERVELNRQWAKERKNDYYGNRVESKEPNSSPSSQTCLSRFLSRFGR